MIKKLNKYELMIRCHYELQLKVHMDVFMYVYIETMTEED